MSHKESRYGRRAFLKGVGTVAGAAAMVPLVDACGSASGSSGGSTSKTITMGIDYSLTGLTAAYQYLLPSVQVARDEINSAGGILGKSIQFNTQDDQSSPAQDPIVLTKLYSEGVDYIDGPPGSSPTLSSLAVSTPRNMLQSAWANDVQFGDGTKYPYFYQVVYNTQQEAALYVNYLVKDRKITKLAILQENSAFGSAGTQNAKAVISELGATLVDVEVFTQDATDLQVPVQKAKQAGAEGLITFVAPVPTITTMMRAMAALHWHPPVAGHDFVYPTLIDIVGASAAQQIFTISYKPLTYNDSVTVPTRQAAFAKSLAKHSEINKLGPALVVQAPDYDWLYILKKGIEAAGTFDTSKVKAQLDQLTGYQGMLGTISFDATRHSGMSDDSLTLGTLGSVVESGSQGGFFLKRAPGL